MDVWGWLVVYLAVFGLIQFGLYRYFQRRDPAPEPSPRRTESGGSALRKRPTHAGDGVRCSQCGAVNESGQMIRFCRACVASLR